jgi:hypothetical protein
MLAGFIQIKINFIHTYILSVKSYKQEEKVGQVCQLQNYN